MSNLSKSRNHEHKPLNQEQRETGLYRPEFEHDSCGVGIVADILGRKSHTLIEMGLEVLNNLAHRD